MRKIIFILSLSILAILAGCSFKPTYYSKSEVKAFIKDTFGSDYKLVEVNKSNSNSDKKVKIYEYIFEDNNGLKFSVYSSSKKEWVDATETKYYQKSLETNYLTSVMNYNLNEINNITKILPFNVEVDSKNKHIDFYLNDINQVDTTANAIINIDQLLSLNYKLDSKYIGEIAVNIHYNPLNSSNISNNYASVLTLSTDDNTRLNYSTVTVKIKNDIENYTSRHN